MVSDWPTLAPGSPANRIQNCYHCFQCVALPTAFLFCWGSSKIHPFTIAPIFCFHYYFCAFKENLDGIFKTIFLSYIQHLEQIAQSSVISNSPSLFDNIASITFFRQAYHDSYLSLQPPRNFLTSNTIPSTYFIFYFKTFVNIQFKFRKEQKWKNIVHL